MSSLKICPQCGGEYELDQRFCPKDGSALKSQSPSEGLVGTVIADRYNVLRKLGEGGMGQVYLAEHVRMGRKSAVKVMNPSMLNDADAISRFNREASNASRINHPNVAAIYDFGETSDGLIYLAMEMVDGEPLTKIIERSGTIPPQRAGSIIKQAADALSAACELGIVHRDLKPDNIMIARGRGDGHNSDVVKIVDFGIAKAGEGDSQKVTRTGLVVGTPEYMSPEQLAGDKVDGRSDIYSLGLVAFNMLTGTLPFPSKSAQEAMIMRLTDRPRTLAEMKPEVAWPTELQRVMDRALAREVNDRYAHSNDFGRDFERAVAQMNTDDGTATQVIGAQPVATATPATSVLQHQTPAAVPKTVVSATKKSKMPLIGGAIGAVAVAAGIAFVMMNKGDNPGSTQTSVSSTPVAATQELKAPTEQPIPTPTITPKAPTPIATVEPASVPATNSNSTDLDKRIQTFLKRTKDLTEAANPPKPLINRSIFESINLINESNNQRDKFLLRLRHAELLGLNDKVMVACKEFRMLSKVRPPINQESDYLNGIIASSCPQ